MVADQNGFPPFRTTNGACAYWTAYYFSNCLGLSNQTMAFAVCISMFHVFSWYAINYCRFRNHFEWSNGNVKHYKRFWFLVPLFVLGVRHDLRYLYTITCLYNMYNFSFVNSMHLFSNFITFGIHLINLAQYVIFDIAAIFQFGSLIGIILIERANTASTKKEKTMILGKIKHYLRYENKSNEKKYWHIIKFHIIYT